MEKIGKKTGRCCEMCGHWSLILVEFEDLDICRECEEKISKIAFNGAK